MCRSINDALKRKIKKKKTIKFQNNPRPLAAVPHAIVVPVVMKIVTIARYQKLKLVDKRKA